MKFWKKPLALTLALAVVMSCGLVAMAEDSTATDTGVYDSGQLREALKGTYGTIKLEANIDDLGETLKIGRAVTINGNGKHLAFCTSVAHKNGIDITKPGVTISNLEISGPQNGKYGIQVWRSDNVTLNDVTITGAGWGGLLVNGSKVTATNLSLEGNQLGGIEINKNGDLDASITLNNYAYNGPLDKPAIWIDGVSEEGITISGHDSFKSEVVSGQIWYTVTETSKEVSDESALVDALKNRDITEITLAQDISLKNKLVINRAVKIQGKDGSETITAPTAAHAIEIVGVQASTATVALSNLTVVGGKYAVHAYHSNVALSDVTLKDAAIGGLLVNGSAIEATDLTLENNTLGGIEINKSGSLDASITLKNYVYNGPLDKPAIWIDGASEEGITISGHDSFKQETVKYGERGNNSGNDQIWYTKASSTKHDVKINNGVIISPTGTAFEKDTEITVKASSAPTGKTFDKWTSDDVDVIFAEATKETTTFIMPDKDVTVTATYDPVVIPPVKTPPVITTTALTKGKVGTAYSATLTATGTAPITWAVKEGSTLPTGLSLSGDGKITGTPTTAGTFKFNVKATNDAGSKDTELTLVVDSAGSTGGSSGGSGGGSSSPSQNTANSSETTSRITEAADALRTSGAALPQGVVAAQVPNSSGASTPISVVPVSLTSGSAALSVGTINTVGSVPSNVGIQASIDNGAAIVTLTGGFGSVTEPGRFYYPMDFAPKAPDSAAMLGAVKSENAASDAFKLGANFTLPKPASLSVNTPIANGARVNIYVFNPQTGRFTLVASTTVANGRLNFATATFGQFLVTTGRI